MNSTENKNRLPRRQVLQWIAAATATGTVGIPGLPALGQTPGAEGYGTDPNLVAPHEPGGYWPLTFSEPDQKTVAALADVILPADDLGPAASAVRVPEYIDEWVSAPYPAQKNDRKVFIPGLEALHAYTGKKFGKRFEELSDAEKIAVCESITKPEPDAKALSGFFHKFTSIAMGAYYSTQEGWKAIGYHGNIPTVTFDGPPPEVLDRVGVEQTVND